MLKLMAVVFVILDICQTQALPTNRNRAVEIDFSADSNVYPANGAVQIDKRLSSYK